MLAFLAGCATPPKDDAAQAPPAEKSTSGKPPAAVKSARQRAAAKAQAGQSAKNEPAPATGKRDEAQPAGASPALSLDNLPPEGGPPMTDAERDALAEMIRAAVIAAQKEQGEKQPNVPAQPAAAGQTQAKEPAAKPVAQADPASLAKGAPQTPADAAQAPKAGCGATSGEPIDLTPPPPDKPQPKFTVAERKVVSEGSWGAKPADFTFTIGNDGDAPLAVRLKGG